MDNNTYISILIDSQRKKLQLLDGVIRETKRQTELLREEEFDEEAFYAIVEHKGKLIEGIENLDAGFEDVYTRVREEVTANPDEFRDSIIELQKIITKVTDAGVEIETLENSNKTLFEIKLGAGRKKIKEFRVGQQTAAAYYKLMTDKHREGDSYFMDKRK